jgi:hypothetical protein
MPPKYNRNIKICSTKSLPNLNTKYLQYPTLSLAEGDFFSRKVRPLWLKQAKNLGC